MKPSRQRRGGAPVRITGVSAHEVAHRDELASWQKGSGASCVLDRSAVSCAHRPKPPKATRQRGAARAGAALAAQRMKREQRTQTNNAAW